MLWCFLIHGKKGGVEDRMNLPLGGNAEKECCSGDYFFHLKRTRSFHLEFLGSIHVKVGGLSQTLSPTFHGVNLEVIHSFIFCWAIL